MGAGSRAKRISRIAAAMPLADTLRENTEAHNKSWMMRHDSRENDQLWVATPFSVTTISDAVEESNFRMAKAMLNDASGFSRKTYFFRSDPSWYWSGGTNTRHDAWPGGTIETLLVRIDDALALRELDRIISALADCPILDESDHAELEHKQNHPNDHTCYAGEDCGCAYRTHAHDEPVDLDEDGEFWCEYCDDWVTPGSPNSASS